MPHRYFSRYSFSLLPVSLSHYYTLPSPPACCLQHHCNAVLADPLSGPSVIPPPDDRRLKDRRVRRRLPRPPHHPPRHRPSLPHRPPPVSTPQYFRTPKPTPSEALFRGDCPRTSPLPSHLSLSFLSSETYTHLMHRARQRIIFSGRRPRCSHRPRTGRSPPRPSAAASEPPRPLTSCLARALSSLSSWRPFSL